MLLLWADEDPRHPLQTAEEALDLLPDGLLRVVPRTGYLMAYDDPVGGRARDRGVLRLSVGFAAHPEPLRSPHPMAKLYGGETAKAVENFPISGEPVPRRVIHWLGRIKGAAAARQRRPRPARRASSPKAIAGAGDEVAAGEHDDQFPIDVFQTGSGTSSNMNANEVIANLAGDGVHPNDHVNMGQSSQRRLPVAPCTSPRSTSPSTRLLPALKHAREVVREEGRASSRTSSRPAART